MKDRRGYSLTELMAAMSVGTVILGLATGTVHNALLLGSQSQDRYELHQVTSRLSDNFRHDVHRAENVSIANEGDAPATMRLSVPRQKDIIYQIEGSRVLRQQSIDGGTSTEVYDFPAGYTISFIQPDSGSVELLVESNSKLKGIPPKTKLFLTPEVGRLLRLSSIEEFTP